VVAEGIEELSQLTALEEMGCEKAQGFMMAEPTPPEFLAGLPSSRPAGRAVGSQAV